MTYTATMVRRGQEGLDSQDRSRPKRAWRIFLATLLFSLCGLTGSQIVPLIEDLSQSPAVTTPFGILYFNEPTEWLVRHEECHYEQMLAVGALAYYTDYIFGGACEEEVRCGASVTKHYACTHYPLSRIPEQAVSQVPWWSTFTTK